MLDLTRVIDAAPEGAYNQKAVELIVSNAVKYALSQYGIQQPKIDGEVSDIDSVSLQRREEIEITKRRRYKVELESGDVVWMSGDSFGDAFRKGLNLYGQPAPEPKRKAPTLKEFVDQTYRPSFIRGLAPKTVDTYEAYLKLNILPFLGEKKLDEITVATIQGFYDWMATAASRGRKKNLNEKTIERIGGLLSKIFRVAVEMNLIKESPIKKALLRNSGEPSGHYKAISREDMRRIKEAIPFLKVERERLYMALLAYAGMRPEEILGLRWNRVFLEEGYCQMVRTVTYATVEGKNKSTVIRDVGKTKTSVRTVILPDAAIQVLKTASRKEGYVIGGDKPLCYSAFKRTYERAFENLGMKGKCCNYDFRTTYGTELCEAGLTSKQVGDLMGHADTRMVETVYARSRHEGIMMQRNMLNRLNEKFER